MLNNIAAGVALLLSLKAAQVFYVVIQFRHSSVPGQQRLQNTLTFLKLNLLIKPVAKTLKA